MDIYNDPIATYILSVNFINGLDNRAKKRLFDPTQAEEASTYVLEKLTENDFRRARAFKGNSKLSTYLYSVCGRLLEEYIRKKQGRRRPPVWVQALGPEWIELWKKIAVERLSRAAILEHYRLQFAEQACQDNLTSDPNDLSSLQQFNTIDQVSEAISQISGKLPSCGKVHQELSASDLMHEDEDESSGDFFDHQGDQKYAPEHLLIQAEFDQIREQFLTVIKQEMNKPNETPALCEGLLYQKVIHYLSAKLPHYSDDLKALQIHMLKGETKTNTAKQLSISLKKLNSILRETINELRNSLSFAGIEITTLREPSPSES